jgi:hypothetical protein
LAKTLADAAARAEIVARIRKLDSSHAANWGRMSAHQMLCHLRDSFLVAMGEKTVSPASGLFQRTIMKFVALQIPIEWPKNISTRPEVEQGIGGTPPADFGQDRASLILVLSRFCDDSRCLAGLRHPIFGKMSQSEWLRWGYLHSDHHLRQFGV